MNDGISVADSSLSYMSVDIAKVVVQMGPGALLGKTDVQSAYRIIPVHPEDRWLLDMQWQGRVYVDTCLPFDLRSAPIIFTAVVDALEWIVKARGVRVLCHYLDDFITVGAPDTGECQANMICLAQICEQLRVPLAPHKCEGPSTCLKSQLTNFRG